MQHIARLSVLLASFVLATPFAFADPLYSFGSVSQTFTDNSLTLGFVFTADTGFTVDSLGWFDATGNGFQSPHTVGIFDANGDLLTSTTLGTGAGSPLTGSFRYQSITPIILVAGSTYTLAGTSGGSLDAWTVNDDVSGLTINPLFTIAANAARFEYTSGLVYPTSHFSDYLLYAGPNLEGHPASSPVPEPASLLLLALAVPILVVARKPLSHRMQHCPGIAPAQAAPNNRSIHCSMPSPVLAETAIVSIHCLACPALPRGHRASETVR